MTLRVNTMFNLKLSMYVTSMVNASLEQGRLPVSQKHAVVTPLLKKPGLDAADMSNYRPVSNRDEPKFGERRSSAEQFGRMFGSVRLGNM